MSIKPLTDNRLKRIVRDLAKNDGAFARVFAQYGYPPLWDRPASFDSLVLMVLEQQVSLASARATFDKLNQSVSKLTPRTFSKLTADDLKSIGFSHQKASYCRGIAESMISGELDLNAIAAMNDLDAQNRLMEIRGVGQWTSCIYLIMVLLRQDIWPNGDRALAVGAKEVLELAEVPSYADLEKLANQWRPYRSVAARLIWHHYLKTRGK